MKIMCISDTHYPYAHPDHLDFLKALKVKYKFGAKDSVCLKYTLSS